MAIARITGQDKTGSTSATYTGATTAGHLLLAVVFAVTDTPTISGWTQVVVAQPAAGLYFLALFAKTAAGTETTVTPGGGGTIGATCICEYSGTANPYVTDGTAGTSTGISGTSLATAAITTVNANDLIFTAAIADSGTNHPTGETWTTGSPILIQNWGSGGGAWGGEHIVSSTQSGYSDTAKWTQTSTVHCGTVIAAFKALPLPYAPSGPLSSAALMRAATR